MAEDVLENLPEQIYKKLPDGQYRMLLQEPGETRRRLLLNVTIRNGKPSALGAISGAVAGLATVTQGSGYVEPFSAAAFGVAAGFGCYFMVAVVKTKLKYDDSLDAFGVRTPPARYARSGAIESFVTSPAHTRSHSATSTSASDASGTAPRSGSQNDAPRSARWRRSISTRASCRMGLLR